MRVGKRSEITGFRQETALVLYETSPRMVYKSRQWRWPMRLSSQWSGEKIVLCDSADACRDRAFPV